MKLSRSFLISLLVFSVLFPFLFHSPFLDDGLEFACVAHTGGISHPPGYPLYTLLTILFSRMMFWISPYLSLSIMSLLLHALTAGIAHKVCCRLVSQRVATVSVLILFGCTQIIRTALVPEVYSLHHLFFWLILMILTADLSSEGKLKRILLIQSLAMTHHLTAVFFSLLWLPLAWKVYRDHQHSTPFPWISTLFISIIPLALYLYLHRSILSSDQFGNPVT